MGTISKALELLNHFSRTKPEIGLGEFVRLTGRDKATLHRHLVELERNGFLEQHPVTRAYRLGPAILRLTGVREATHPVRSVLKPVAEAMSHEVGELVHVSLLQGDVLSPVYHADPMRHGTQVHFDEAELLPLHATSSGLAVLAFCAPDFVDALLAGDLTRYTEATVTDPARLREMLAEIRAAGVSRLAQSFDGEVTSQAAPIFGPEAEVTGAVSVAVPSVRASADKLSAVVGPLCQGALRATHSIGGSVPPELAEKWRAALPPEHQRRDAQEA